jgi:hypothetical protein
MHTRDDGRDAPDARDRPIRGERERNDRRDTDRRRRTTERERPIEARAGRNERDPERPRRPRVEEEEENSTPRAASKRLPALEAAKAGLQQLAIVTGREPQGVVSLVPEENGWRIGIEIVEDRRIPSSTDVVGLYEALVDDDGELTGYTRKRRYPRGKSDGGESG